MPSSKPPGVSKRLLCSEGAPAESPPRRCSFSSRTLRTGLSRIAGAARRASSSWSPNPRLRLMPPFSGVALRAARCGSSKSCGAARGGVDGDAIGIGGTTPPARGDPVGIAPLAAAAARGEACAPPVFRGEGRRSATWSCGARDVRGAGLKLLWNRQNSRFLLDGVRFAALYL